VRQVEIDAYGGLDVLQIKEREDPAVMAGEVLIDVTYAGVGLIDAILREGMLPLPLPFVPGLEVSGHIRAIGEGVQGFKIGDPVVAMTLLRFGGYASVVSVPAQSVLSVIDGVDLKTAAGVIVNFATAQFILGDLAPVGAASRILVHGASGGLGTACVAIAKAHGVKQIVATTSSPAKTAYLKSIGATTVIGVKDLKASLEAEGIDLQFDIIIDPVGGDLRTESFDLLALRGKLLIVGGAEQGEDIAFSSKAIWLNNYEIIGVNIGGMSNAEPARVAKAGSIVLDMIATGRLSAGPIAVLPVEEVGEAHRRLEAKEITGKLLLQF
jgi:NADPH2:quinone reductase